MPYRKDPVRPVFPDRGGKLQLLPSTFHFCRVSCSSCLWFIENSFTLSRFRWENLRRGESGSICVLRCWHSNYKPTLLFLLVFYYSLSRSHSGAIHHADGQDCGLTFLLRGAIVPPICHSHLLSLLQTLHLSLLPPSPLSMVLRLVKDGRHRQPPLLFSATHSVSSGSLSILCSSLFCGVFVWYSVCVYRGLLAVNKQTNKNLLLEHIFNFPFLS